MNDRSLLDGISIASPCSADWNQMEGDARRRFCASCKLHVHDLSGMTAAEATALLRTAGQGRVCVRLFRRADGTVLTRDCPVGLRQKLRRAWARAGALWCALWAGTAACARQAPAQPPAPRLVPMQGEVVMGDVAAPREEKGKVHVPAPQTPPPK
jgi:hypothetical protein